MGDPRRLTASSPARRGIPPLRRLLRQREGGGSPSPACTYGRVGWCSRRRRSGEGGAAGGWFGVEGLFSGGAVLRSSASSSSTCWSWESGVALELLVSPPDLGWRRIWRPEPRTGRGRRLRPASSTMVAAARRWCRRGRVLAVPVHRLRLRRGAADKFCGLLQQGRRPQAAVRRRMATLVVDAGEEGVSVSGSELPFVLYSVSVFVLCTLYVVLC